MSPMRSSTGHGGMARQKIWGAVGDRPKPLAMSCSAANSNQRFPPARRPGNCFSERPDVVLSVALRAALFQDLKWALDPRALLLGDMVVRVLRVYRA
eukprot:2034404-Pyramimonas_sp.AAC.1